MDKKELLECAAWSLKISSPEDLEKLEAICDAIFEIIANAVADGKTVEIPGFGVFHRSYKHLGRTSMPSSKKVPDFSPDLNFRDKVRDGTASVEG
jgi:nucleoid DNA-binding protein